MISSDFPKSDLDAPIRAIPAGLADPVIPVIDRALEGAIGPVSRAEIGHKLGGDVAVGVGWNIAGFDFMKLRCAGNLIEIGNGGFVIGAFDDIDRVDKNDQQARKDADNTDNYK